jgi:predicted aspartyl protease
MGHVKVPLRITNPNDPDLSIELEDALVDAGTARATLTFVPRFIVSSLNLTAIGHLDVRTETGRKQFEQSYARIELHGKETVTGFLISDSVETVTIGSITLLALGLRFDPDSEQLVTTESYLMPVT